MAVTLDMFEYANDGAAQTAYPTDDTVDDPIAHWKMNDDAADTNVDDSMDNAEGTLRGGDNTNAKSEVGQINDCLHLNGVDDYISATLPSTYTSWTLAVWINLDAVGAAGDSKNMILGNDAGDIYIGFNSDGTNATPQYHSGGWNNATSSITAGNWHLIIFSMDSVNGMAFYIDGGTAGTNAALKTMPAALTLGRRVEGAPFYFDGKFDDYRIYNKALTSQDVTALWNGGSGTEAQNPASTKLQCYSEDTIKKEGDYSLKGVALITGSLNDTFTRTVDPTINLSGQNIIRIWIRSSRTGSNFKIGIHDSGGTTTEKTPNILVANTWQLVTWDISGVADVDKDVIDSIIITIVNASSSNTFYLDDFWAHDGIWILTLEENLAMLESETVAINCLFEENLALSEALTDIKMPDATWEAMIEAQIVNEVAIYFEHKGVDYSEYLNDVSTITRSADLTSGWGTAILSNVDQTWNLFLADRTEIGSAGILGLKPIDSLGFTNRTKLFTGKIDDVSYTGVEAVLKVRDSLVSTLEKRLGNGENPVEYLTPQNPADLVWELLVTEGGLDSTASTENTDIDYTSWSDWDTDCDTLKYSLQAKFTGHYITTALLMIAELTSSYIWVAGDGKFNFKRPIPPFTPSALPRYDRSNCLQIDVAVTKENLTNYFRCRYGWDEDVNEWTGSVLEEDATSQTDYGIYTGVEEGKVVWHADEDSAGEMAERVVDKNKTPLAQLTITSTLRGVLLGLGDTILITELLKNLNPIYVRVEEMHNIDVTQGLVHFICRDISDEQIAAFLLDDAYWGLLDQDYNPMV